MDAAPSTAPTTSTGDEPSTVAGAPIGVTLSASSDRGASDLVDNQARRALAEIIAAAGLGIPTDGARERAAAEEPTTRVTANARHVLGNSDHDRTRVEIRHLAIEREKRLIADPIASGRIGRIAWLDAQPSGNRGLMIHAIDAAQSTIRRPNASGPRRPSERGGGPDRKTHDGDAHPSARRIAKPGQHGTFRLTRVPACDDQADASAARRVEVRHFPDARSQKRRELPPCRTREGSLVRFEGGGERMGGSLQKT
jgi:hypothetical protein